MLAIMNGKKIESFVVTSWNDVDERTRTAQIVSTYDPNKSAPNPKMSLKTIPTHIEISPRSSLSSKS